MRMDRQGRTWFRRFPVGLLIALVGMGLWLWRSDTASAAERVWVFSAFVSAVFCVWGYAEARRTKGWVTDQQQTHPRRDYAGARIVAQTHYVTHIILLLAQLAFLQFGIFAALTAPAECVAGVAAARAGARGGRHRRRLGKGGTTCSISDW